MLEALIEKHSELLAQAVDAVKTRKAWSAYNESPSTKIHGPDKPVDGKAAFQARLKKKFMLDFPGVETWVGEEVSPFTLEPLEVTYPACNPDSLIEAGSAAMPAWAKARPELRLSICLEMAERLYDRNFEMAHAIMHVAGQSYTQAFSGSGPNALDRGIEALAYAAIAMGGIEPTAVYRREFAGEPVALEKSYTLVPRGLGLVICCASFPTWNAYPSMFASLATGNPVIVKPHPKSVLPMAIAVETCRAVLTEYGFDPNLVTLAVDTLADPVAGKYVDHPSVQIIDFTGSPRYGSFLERTVSNKLLYTETAGVNSVVIESTDNLTETTRAIARGSSLFSGQMCSSPQVIYVPKNGVDSDGVHVSYWDVADAIVSQIDAIVDNPKAAAGIMGAIQGDVSLDVIADVEAVAEREGLAVLRRAVPYEHPDFPAARTRTPMVIALSSEHKEVYAEERFGPVLFIVAAEDADAAAAEATELARTRGVISSYMYSADDAFIDRWLDVYAQVGANLTINLTGAMWINFAAAYSDYHVTGLNPAGNACLTDISFVASRFRITQHRRPLVDKND